MTTNSKPLGYLTHASAQRLRNGGACEPMWAAPPGRAQAAPFEPDPIAVYDHPADNPGRINTLEAEIERLRGVLDEIREAATGLRSLPTAQDASAWLDAHCPAGWGCETAVVSGAGWVAHGADRWTDPLPTHIAAREALARKLGWPGPAPASPATPAASDASQGTPEPAARPGATSGRRCGTCAAWRKSCRDQGVCTLAGIAPAGRAR